MNFLIGILLDALLLVTILDTQECSYVCRTGMLFRSEFLTKFFAHLLDELTIGIRYKFLD